MGKGTKKYTDDNRRLYISLFDYDRLELHLAVA